MASSNFFLLFFKDQRQMHFCINVDPPIKQGQTRYHYLIMNFRQVREIMGILQYGLEMVPITRHDISQC